MSSSARPGAISDDLLKLVTRRLQLLSDPARVRILMMLEQHETSVQEIADEVGTTPQNVSYHLAVMYREGVLSRRKEGTTVFYSIADYTACRLLDQVAASVKAQVEELGELFIAD
jgi:DNA-binding transcriptional ArsR family regulator